MWPCTVRYDFHCNLASIWKVAHACAEQILHLREHATPSRPSCAILNTRELCRESVLGWASYPVSWPSHTPRTISPSKGGIRVLQRISSHDSVLRLAGIYNWPFTQRLPLEVVQRGASNAMLCVRVALRFSVCLHMSVLSSDVPCPMRMLLDSCKSSRTNCALYGDVWKAWPPLHRMPRRPPVLVAQPNCIANQRLKCHEKASRRPDNF